MSSVYTGTGFWKTFNYSGYHSTRSDVSDFLIDIIVPLLRPLGRYALLHRSEVGQCKVVEVFLQPVDLGVTSVSDPGPFVRIRIGHFFPSPDPDRQKIRIRIYKKNALKL